MEERELNQADKKLVKTIPKRVSAALRNLRDRGMVQSAEPVIVAMGAWVER